MGTHVMAHSQGPYYDKFSCHGLGCLWDSASHTVLPVLYQLSRIANLAHARRTTNAYFRLRIHVNKDGRR